MRDLRMVTQFRRTERVDSARRVPLVGAPQGVPCGKSVEQMRRDTEVYLSQLFGREVKILARTKP